jgi:hypothetical protein
MTREDIIRMAQEAGFDYSGAELSWESVICTEELERFANLVAFAEREACAKVCEEYETENDITTTWLNIVAEGIRARGQA